MAEWSEIADALRHISKQWEDRKSSDGSIEISFNSKGEISVEIFAYGSKTMDRHHTIGPFYTEEQAKIETKNLLSKECIDLIDNLEKERKPLFKIPAVLLG